MRGFVRTIVVEVKCGRKIMERSVLDVIKKYVADVVSKELAVGAMKQIVGFADLTKYSFVEVKIIMKFVSMSKNVKSTI